MKLSDKDELILDRIMKDPRILLADISDALKGDNDASAIPYPTVQRRVQQMTANRILTRGYVIDFAKAGYIFRYRVGVSIDPVALRASKGEDDEYGTQIELAHYIRTVLPREPQFRDKLVVNDVYVLLGGSSDLAVDVYAKHDRTVTEFIIDGLRNLRGVKDTSSAKLAYSSKYGWLGQNGEGEGRDSGPQKSS